MAKIKIVKRSDLSIQTTYEADAPEQHKYGGPWGDPNKTKHVQVPAGADEECVTAQWSQEYWSKDGEADVTTDPQDPTWTHHPSVIELVEDQTLLYAKQQKGRDDKLGELRTQRDKRLEKADNQLKKHADSDPNAIATEADWQSHRIALRDLTDSYKDAQDDTRGTSALDAYSADMSDFDGWPVEPS